MGDKHPAVHPHLCLRVGDTARYIVSGNYRRPKAVCKPANSAALPPWLLDLVLRKEQNRSRLQWLYDLKAQAAPVWRVMRCGRIQTRHYKRSAVP